jgi:4-carboxymuconolactone decarboxylase
MPEIPPAQLTDAQKQATGEFQTLRKTPVFGPFVPLLRSPELMLAANRMGLYLRYNSVLPLRISEFAILLVARHWSQPVEWQIHHPIALKAGVAPGTAAAIADGRRPDAMNEDEAVVWDFTTELQSNKSVSDRTYSRALETFGEQGVVDLTGICGYYALLAMTMNVARTAAGPGEKPALPSLP